MMFFTIILVLLILLIFISMLNPIQSFALKLVTREHYNEHQLILPAFLTIMVWAIAFSIIINLISNATGMSIWEVISASLFNTSNFKVYIPNLILPIILIITISLLLQALSLLTINVDYGKFKNIFKYYINNKSESIKKKMKQDEYHEMICGETITEGQRNQISTIEERYILDYINAFVCSLFIFSFLFFLIILFLFIGSSIGRKVI